MAKDPPKPIPTKKKNKTKHDTKGTPGGTEKVDVPVYQELHIMQASMQFDDSSENFKADLRANLDREPDVICFSEINRFRQEITTLGTAAGYKPMLDPAVEEGFLVKTSSSLKVKDYGKKKILDQYGKTLVPPWHSTRYISWVKLDFYGLTVYVHTQHWLAHIYELPLFETQHAMQSRQMGAQMKAHGNEAGAVAFFTGDMNWDKTYQSFKTENRPDVIFGAYQCQDIYTELNVGQPATFKDGRTLDYVVKYLPDGAAVTGARFKVWPQYNSDHRPMSAWYNIVVDTTRQTTVDNGWTLDDETGGKPPDSPLVDLYPYDSAGDINYDDYRDDTTYLIQTIIEDSDYLRS